MIIDFGEYLPDLPAIGHPGLIQATNCIPYQKSYRSFPSPQIYSTSISNRCQGYIGVTDTSGNSYNYSGDSSALYSLSGTSWSNVTRASGGNYNTDSSEVWEFAQWGSQVVATNWADVSQVITLGASNFAALSGSPPKARHMGVVKNFLVLGNVTDYSGGASLPTRIHWSGFENITQWTPAASTQCDYQDLQGDGGWIQRVIGGEYGTIFQERSIWRMTYVGSPLVFQFDEIEPGRGTPSPGSVIKVGHLIFYLGQDDFYMFNGVSSTPIGSQKVYETFRNDLDSSYDYRISAQIDPIRTLVIWAYPGIGNNGGNPNKLLIYNWSIGRWSIVQTEVELLCQMRQPGYTLDQLDSISSDIELLSYSLDSRAYMGGTINLAAFNTDHRLTMFQGTGLSSTFETGEKVLGRRSIITSITPIVDTTSVTVQIGSRNLPSSSASYSNAISVNTDGECPIDAEGRYHRFKVNTTGDFTHAQGLDVDVITQGRY